jgi:hypothetical protein
VNLVECHAVNRLIGPPELARQAGALFRVAHAAAGGP